MVWCTESGMLPWKTRQKFDPKERRAHMAKEHLPQTDQQFVNRYGLNSIFNNDKTRYANTAFIIISIINFAIDISFTRLSFGVVRGYT